MKKAVWILSLAFLSLQACTGTHFFDKPYPGNCTALPESFQGKYLATQSLWKSFFQKKSPNDTLYMYSNDIRLGGLDTTLHLDPNQCQLSQLNKSLVVTSIRDDQQPNYWNIVVLERSGNKLKWYPIGNYSWDKDPLRKYLNLMRLVKTNEVLQKGIINHLNDSLIREAYTSNNGSDTVLYYEMNPDLFTKFLDSELKKNHFIEFKKVRP